ncbi:unnamed protein product [Laminaria digitata]
MGHCSHGSSRRRPTVNVESSKAGAYCKDHAEDGMVDVVNTRCSHDSCTRRSIFNIAGSKTPAYCKQHANEGMLDVFNNRCSYDSCATQQASTSRAARLQYTATNMPRMAW